MIIEQIRKWLGRQYQALNRIEVSRARLKKNYLYLNSLNKKIKVAPVIKSNAYGHGLITVAKILDALKPPFFCVDGIHEAYLLLKAKIRSPILIMGYINPENLRVKRLPFSYAVYSLSQLNSILNYQPEAGVHLFVDSGMGREGIPLSEFANFVKMIPVGQRKNIEGIMSHFAASLRPQDTRTKKQVKNFAKATAILNRQNIFPKWRHIANSGGLINNKALRLDQVSNLARCGLAVYLLNPALRFLTHIAQIKTMAKDNAVGYDFTFTAKKDMTMAVLPVGYNDGVDRGLSNKGVVQINGVICPIIGRVSMNITTVDVSNVANVKVGDEVVVYSDDNKLPNSIRATSSMLRDTIEYELLVHLNPEIKRVVV